MRYSMERKYRKQVNGYGFLSFSRKIGDKYGKKFRDTAAKTGLDAEETTFRGVLQKAAEDFIGNKIVNKNTSSGKTKSKQREDERQEI